MSTTTYTSYQSNVEGTDDDDFFTFEANAGDVDMGGGSDRVDLDDGVTINKLDLGDGNNNVYGSNSGYISNLDAGDGNDSVYLGGGAGNVDLGDGNNEFFMYDSGEDSSTSDYTNDLTVGAGDDTVSLQGANNVKLNGGNDYFEATEYVQNVEGGDGDDFFYLQGGGQIKGDDGDDTLRLDGTIDDYTVSNYSSNSGYVQLTDDDGHSYYVSDVENFEFQNDVETVTYSFSDLDAFV